MALLNGVLFMKGENGIPMVDLLSTVSGNSIIVVLYMLVLNSQGVRKTETVKPHRFGFHFFNLIEINYSKHHNKFSAINIKNYIQENEINF